METTHPFAPETCRRERLRFAFMHGKGGKRPGFTDSTGEYRDTRTGWLRGPVSSEPVSGPNSPANRENNREYRGIRADRRPRCRKGPRYSNGLEANSLRTLNREFSEA